MNTNDKTTELLNRLLTIKSDAELQEYLKKHTSDKISFSNYYNSVLNKKGISLTDAIKASGLESHYAYQIVNGTKKKAGRDKIICLCIGAQMNIKEIRRALEISLNGILYAQNTRDAIIIQCINTENWSIKNINEKLYQYNLETLQ